MMITTAYTISVTLMILAPIVAAVLLRRRVQAPWFLFLVGAATFIGSQVVHLPLNDWLADIGLLPGNNTLEASGISLLQTCIILGLTAGLCEELGLDMVRAGTVGCHPRYVQMIRELVVERMDPSAARLALGDHAAPADLCSSDCCPRPSA